MQLTITEAAKLYGKQRKTLYRHIDSGRLSCSVRGDGHRVIDLSELIRCYGETPTRVDTSDTPVTRQDSAGDTLTRAMLEELVALRREVEQLRADLRRLPAPAPSPEPPFSPDLPESSQSEQSADPDPLGLRSLVATLRNQTH
ncbi:helix-turn-helix domain-containing protein [Halomonas korlensis]|uniref:helix-turn-helix domain-containing protein n=1 Tax=Halomonas korlensis TaxID=463301 RepID=UPI000B7DA9C4|nr:helix-turn-helix domain-containing protein [Halomonas korlensis]